MAEEPEIQHVNILGIDCPENELVMLDLGTRIISLAVVKDYNVHMDDASFWTQVEAELDLCKTQLLTIDQGYEILHDRTVKDGKNRTYFFKLDITPANQQKHSEIFCGIKHWVGDKLQIVS